LWNQAVTHTPLTKAEREELRRLDDQDRAVWTHDRGSVESQDPRALPDETSGFCYYMGSGAPLAAAARNALPRLLADLDAAEAERDAHKELIDAARYDVGERSFLEDAQNILKECVAAYSCEQMQAVAKALRQWRDKWAILLETVVRTCEDRDDMMAQRDALKAKVDTERQRQNATLAKLREELGADLGCGGGLVEILTGIIGLREQRDALKAKLAALVDFNVAELGRTRKEVWPDCEFCRDSTHDHECAGPELNPRWVELNAAIAAARGGAS
jgi:hypothetical protein